MQSQGFLPAFLAGLFPAFGIAGALFLVLVLAGVLDDQAILVFAASIGTPAVVFAGTALTGALCGVVAGPRAGRLRVAAGAGAAAGTGGALVILLVAAVGGTLMEAAADGDPASPLPWNELHLGLLFLVPAAAAGTLAAMGAPLHAQAHSTAPAHAPAYAGAGGPGLGIGSDRRMKCPKCSSTVMVPAGQSPYCQNCGFGG